MNRILTKGTQIIYVPPHLDLETVRVDPAQYLAWWAENGKILPIECGFVFESPANSSRHVFCRFFSNYSPGDLRTRNNSEATPIDRIVRYDAYPQAVVDAWITILEFNKE